MDYDYVNRLEKSLEDLYVTKFNAFFNAKEFGDLREVQGWMKAIRAFGDMIKEAHNKPVKGDGIDVIG